MKIFIAIASAMLVAGIGLIIAFGYAFGYGVNRGFKDQGLQVAAVRPLFDAAVTSKLKVGDTMAHAKDVLTYAGLEFEQPAELPPRRILQSMYRAGDGCGLSIQLDFDSDDRISKIDIHEYFTGP